MATVSKQGWLDEGQAVIIEQGFKGLTLQVLLKRLGVTHGSFYHHFKNRQSYTEALLAEWEQQMTVAIIDATAAIDALPDRVDALIDRAHNQQQQTALEVAIRAQAFSDPLVASYVERVDALRLQHSYSIALAATGDKKRASTIGNLIHAVFVGSQQIRPAFNQQQMDDIYKELRQLARNS